MTLRDYVVKTSFGCSSVVCSKPIAQHIALLATPFFELREGHHHAGWKVFAPECNLPPPPLEEVFVSALGEVPIRYRIDSSRQYLQHCEPVTKHWVAQSLLRATRSIHRSEAQRQGVLFAHSALVEIEGKGVAFVGGSRSGKTSLVLATVRGDSGSMISNDDLGFYLDAEARDAIIGLGWPRSISIRLDTLETVFGSARREEICRSLTHPANETIRSLIKAGIEPHGTALFYPYEYESLFGARIRASHRVDALVFLSLSNQRRDRELRTVSEAEALRLLSESRLLKPNKYLNLLTSREDPQLTDRALSRAASLPSFRFCYEFAETRSESDLLVEELQRLLS